MPATVPAIARRFDDVHDIRVDRIVYGHFADRRLQRLDVFATDDRLELVDRLALAMAGQYV